MDIQDVLDRLKHPKRGLPALLQGPSREGTKTIKEALELFDYLELLQWSVDDLWATSRAIRCLWMLEEMGALC